MKKFSKVSESKVDPYAKFNHIIEDLDDYCIELSDEKLTYEISNIFKWINASDVHENRIALNIRIEYSEYDSNKKLQNAFYLKIHTILAKIIKRMDLYSDDNEVNYNYRDKWDQDGEDVVNCLSVSFKLKDSL